MKSQRSAWLLAGLLAVPAVAGAVSTKSFSIDTSDAFEKGTVEGAAVHSSGKVVRSLRTARHALDGVAVSYASAVGPDGAIYVATGNEGAIYRVDASLAGGEARVDVSRAGGEARVDRAPKLFADTPAALVTSLLWADGTLYAGTLPGGRVYAIAADGKARELAQLAADHVWALAYGNKKLYAATGPDGKLFAIDVANGKSQLIYDDSAEHLLCLARDAQGRLFAGTSSGARVVRIDHPEAAKPEARLLWDFPGQEITALALGTEFLAVAANDFPAPPTPANDNKDLSTAARAKRNKLGNGILFALGFDGAPRELARFESAHISALDVEVSGDVQVGLGHEGKIVRVSASGERALWADVEERAISAIHLGGRVPHFVSSDGVAVYRVNEPSATGTWTSAALDAKTLARFGELTFRARGDVRWTTRSGNSETPDDSWSAWSSEQPADGPIKSAPARFLQLRATLAGDAELYAVEAYYLPQNQAARVRNARVKASSGDDKPHSSTIALTWDVDNPDDDKLRHRPSVRREGQSAWLPLLREFEILERTDYAWDTRSTPDGYYRLRVEVSDEASNPPPYAKSTETISPPILVDNRPPLLSELRVERSANKARLRGRVRDALGPIAQLEYAIDSGAAQPLFSDDDLLDTREETFQIDLARLAPGAHVITVRAWDSARNLAAESLEVTIPTR